MKILKYISIGQLSKSTPTNFLMCDIFLMYMPRVLLQYTTYIETLPWLFNTLFKDSISRHFMFSGLW